MGGAFSKATLQPITVLLSGGPGQTRGDWNFPKGSALFEYLNFRGLGLSGSHLALEALAEGRVQSSLVLSGGPAGR